MDRDRGPFVHEKGDMCDSLPRAGVLWDAPGWLDQMFTTGVHSDLSVPKSVPDSKYFYYHFCLLCHK